MQKCILSPCDGPEWLASISAAWSRIFCLLDPPRWKIGFRVLDIIPLYPRSLNLSTYLFSLFAYKVIDLSQKILYPWPVAGDGGKYILGGPTRRSLKNFGSLGTNYKSALRALEALLLFFIFLGQTHSDSYPKAPLVSVPT